MSNATVELTLPVMQDMELAATKTAEVIAKRMELDGDKTDEISMALIEACINAFEHSKTEEGQVEINFSIDDNTLVIKVTDQGVGFDSNTVKIPKIEQKITNPHWCNARPYPDLRLLRLRPRPEVKPQAFLEIYANTKFGMYKKSDIGKSILTFDNH